jgi:tetratricopeptide (TPR) repeat protein
MFGLAGRSLSALAIALAVASAGCASHSDKTAPIRSALDAGRPSEALKLINESLDVDSAQKLPEEVSGDNALLLLDRAMVLQALGDFKTSSRDLEVSDKQIEVLDFSRNAAHDIGKYIFSDDVGPYKAPAYEKLMINTMNMVNYLARGDLGGARIEARRLAVMQKFIADSESKAQALVGLGSYLAGFTFEKSGKADEALHYYDDALHYANYPSLVEPIRRLAADSGYRTDNLRRALGDPATAPSPHTPPAPSSPTPAPTPGAPPEAPSGDAEILVVIGYGRVPAKFAQRVPIGLALTYASVFISPANAATANRLAAQGLVTWINYPELGKARLGTSNPSFALDGRYYQLDGVLAVDREAKLAWDEAKGPVMAAAITRMITRVVAGEALRASAKDSTVGALLSLGTQATLVAVDTPDTRSWETLPARIAVGRVRVPAGKHDIVISANGARVTRKLDLAPNGWSVTALTVLQ